MTKSQAKKLAEIHRELAALYSEIAEPAPRRPKRLPRIEPTSTPEERAEVERMLADRGIE